MKSWFCGLVSVRNGTLGIATVFIVIATTIISICSSDISTLNPEASRLNTEITDTKKNISRKEGDLRDIKLEFALVDPEDEVKVNETNAITDEINAELQVAFDQQWTLGLRLQETEEALAIRWFTIPFTVINLIFSLLLIYGTVKNVERLCIPWYLYNTVIFVIFTIASLGILFLVFSLGVSNSIPQILGHVTVAFGILFGAIIGSVVEWYCLICVGDYIADSFYEGLDGDVKGNSVAAATTSFATAKTLKSLSTSE